MYLIKISFSFWYKKMKKNSLSIYTDLHGLWHWDKILQAMLKLEIHPFAPNRYYLPVNPLLVPFQSADT